MKTDYKVPCCQNCFYFKMWDCYLTPPRLFNHEKILTQGLDTQLVIATAGSLSLIDRRKEFELTTDSGWLVDENGIQQYGPVNPCQFWKHRDFQKTLMEQKELDKE